MLDFYTGVIYLLYLAEIFFVITFLFFKDREMMLCCTWGFFWIHILGFATWVIFAAAPPWYVQEYGLGPAVMNAAPSVAGAMRFDNLVGIDVFAGWYSRNINIFGAMPSLHCALPTMLALNMFHVGKRYAIPASVFAVSMYFSALYLNHHYILDILVGILYASVVYLFCRYVAVWLKQRA